MEPAKATKGRYLQSLLERLGIVPLAFWGQKTIAPCLKILKGAWWRFLTREEVLECEEALTNLVRAGLIEGIAKRIGEGAWVSSHMKSLPDRHGQAGRALHHLMATVENMIHYYNEGRLENLAPDYVKRPLRGIEVAASAALGFKGDEWIDLAMSVDAIILSKCGEGDFSTGLLDAGLLEDLEADLSRIPSLPMPEGRR